MNHCHFGPLLVTLLNAIVYLHQDHGWPTKALEKCAQAPS